MTSQLKKRIKQLQCGEVLKGYKRTKVGIVPNEWSEARFKKMFSRISRKNAENNDNVLTISAQYGLISQHDFFNKDIASEDKSNYFLLYKGEFAYNKSYSNGYSFGALKRLDMYDKGIVSPLYICFSATEDNKCPEFYVHYFEAGNMNREIKAYAQEGARNHGLLNISVDDFFNSYLLIPPLSEQKKIAEILSTQDKLIELNQRKIEQLKKLKKYYLIKMFPRNGSDVPEIRFKGYADAWEQRKFSDLAVTRRGLTYSPVNVSSSGVRVLRSSNIDEDQFVWGDEDVFVDPDAISIPFINNGDILITAANGSSRLVGKHTIIQGLRDNTAVHGGFMLVASAENPNFVNALMSAPWYSKFIGLFVAGGNGAIGNLNKADLDEQAVMVPQEKEQEQIGAFFRRLDHLITLHQRKHEELKKQKKSLMQLLLTGIVRVKT